MIPRARSSPSLVVAALLLGGCATANERGEVPLDAIIAQVEELVGRKAPLRRAQDLLAMHDTATFRHVPDTPDTWENCRRETAALATVDYVDWSEAALAAYMLTRVLVDDASSLNRGQAATSLARIGHMFAEVEDPPAGPPARDADFLRAVARLKALHVPGGHDPAIDGAEAECTGLLIRVGDFRPEGDLGDEPGLLRVRLSDLRAVVNVVLRNHVGEPTGVEGRNAISRALVNASAQSVRTALALALRSDPAETVRAAAADTLEHIRSPEAVPALARALEREESRSVRREIVQSLGTLATAHDAARAAAVPALAAALADDDGAIRLNARRALAAVAGRDLGEDPAPWTAWWAGARRAGP